MSKSDEVFVLDIGGKDNNNPIFKENKNNAFRELKEIKQELKKNNFPEKVIISSGEPTIHPNFFKIVAFIIGYGCKSIILKTNARMLSYSEFSNRLKNCNKIKYFIDVFGPDEEIHDKISNSEGSFKQAISGIRNLSSFDNEVNITIPIVNENNDKLIDTINFLEDYGISNFLFYLPETTTYDFFYKEKIYHNLKENISNLPNETLIQVGFENIPLCVFPENSYYGQKNILLKKRVYDEKCSECHKKTLCPGFSKEEFQYVDKMIIKPFTDIKSKVLNSQIRINKKSTIHIALEEIYKILFHFTEEKNIWDVIYELGYPIPLFLIIIEELQNEGLVEINGDKIKSQAKKKKPKEIIDQSDKRLESNPEVCQLLVSHEDIEKRINYITETCPGGGKMVLLGDDDFLSISLASTGLFDEIWVFEIDERIIDKINLIAKEKNLPITCVQHDLRQKIPKKYLHKFDAAYTDSPYYPNGFSLFISRCIDLLKKDLHLHIFSSFSCEMPIMDDELSVQDIINEMGLFIERKSMPANNIIPSYLAEKYSLFAKLNEIVFKNNKNLSQLDKWYLAALGRKEFLFHFLTTKDTNPIINGIFEEEIYYEDIPFDFYTNPKTVKNLNKIK
ncbi:hypothetical protein CMO93_03085 [Candidatus Woesearchaeota archaeon]|nr:hypothetical protein [Candidatus Woesearchaeota archaeon]|tara:strand:+ start:11324 stop:13180 length:1857 start_codon:yes stop_codon:yes gene_type:complete